MKVRELLKLCIDHGVMDAEVLVEIDGNAIPTLGIKTGTTFAGIGKPDEHWLTIHGTNIWGVEGKSLT
jgi:hypothetical protein